MFIARGELHLNKLVAGLALSTSVFAASAYYFHGELAAARARHEAQPAADAMASTAAPAPVSTSQAEAVQTSLVTAAPGAATTPSQSTADAARKVQSAVWASDFLKRYADPAARADMRALELSRLTSSLAGLDRKIQLDPDAWAKLREMIVDFELERRAVSSRCAVDPACVRPGPAELEALNAREQAIRDFLGDGNYQAMQEFRSLGLERTAVAGLQGRLPANLALSAKQSETLTMAMHEERAAQTRELVSRGQMPGSYGMDGMSVVYAKDAATPEQSMDSAQQYAQRVRDRAALVLNTSQLAVFNQMQDDMMIGFRRHQRQQLARQSDPDKQP